MTDDTIQTVKRAPRAMTETIKDIGQDVERFLNAETPTGNKLSEEQRNMLMRAKKVGVITIEIKCEAGKIPFTLLQDQFNLKLEGVNTSDNVKVLRDKLANISSQIEVLVKHWNSEMGK